MKNEYRQKFDYVDLAISEKEMISDYIEKAKEFERRIEEYLQKNSKNNSLLINLQTIEISFLSLETDI